MYNKITRTKPTIITKKNIISWCNSIIARIIIVAGSWNDIFQCATGEYISGERAAIPNTNFVFQQSALFKFNVLVFVKAS
jgi:hypothetical protein